MALPRLTVQQIPMGDTYNMARQAQADGIFPSALRALGTVGTQYARNKFGENQQAKAEQLVRDYYARTGDYATQPEEILQMAETAQPSIQGMSPEFLPKLPSAQDVEPTPDGSTLELMAGLNPSLLPRLSAEEDAVQPILETPIQPEESTEQLMAGLNPTTLPRLGVEQEITQPIQPTQTASAPAPMRQLGTPQQSEGEARALYLQRLMGIDPNRAQSEQVRLDKVDQLEFNRQKELEAARLAELGKPEEDRRQLRISRDLAYQRATNQAASDEERKIASAEVDLITAEMARKNPDLTVLYSNIDKLYNNRNKPDPKDPGEKVTIDSDWVKTQISNIPYNTDKAALAEVKRQIGEAGFEKGTEDKLIKQAEDQFAARPNPPVGKKPEDKAVFDTFIRGSNVTLGTTAGAIALGQSMGQKIQAALDRGDSELSQSDTQQLAAMIYQTYNPGALVGGEMSSAVGALKGSGAWSQYIDAGLSGLGISSNNKVPIQRAIDSYNSAIAQGANAFQTFIESTKEYKKDKNTDYKFIDAYTAGLVNPQQYIVGKKTTPADNTAPDEIVIEGWK